MVAALVWGIQDPSAVAAQESVAAVEGAPTAESTSSIPPSEPEPAVEDTTRTAKNVLYVELLGNAGAYSLNYERFVTDDINIRLGFEFFSISASGRNEDGNPASVSATILLLPLMFNYFGVGTPDHKLELGAGPVIVYASAESAGIGSQAEGEGIGIAGTATVGYRYVPHDGGFNFKVGFTPLFGEGGFLPWVGIGFGAVF